MRAIETRYKGCRFRSRQEGRWAIFMDSLGVRWVYEPEGFELGSVGRYLPDFYLPDLDRFLEVKPSWGQVTEAEEQKALALAKATEKLVVMVCECAPFINRFNPTTGDVVIENDGTCFAPDGEDESLMLFGFCPTCEHGTLGFLGSHSIHCDARWDRATCPGCAESDHPRVRAAFAAAQSARFEFGRIGT